MLLAAFLLSDPLRARHGEEDAEDAEQAAGVRVSDAEVQERLQHLPPQLWEKLYR